MPLPPIISCFRKIQNGVPFWCRLSQVVLEKMLNVCVCVCGLSRRRKTLIQNRGLRSPLRDTLHVTAVLTNRLGSSLPLDSEYVSLETWDEGAQRLLTLKISQRRLGGQPPHRPLRTPHSSRCRLQVCVCVCKKVCNMGMTFKDTQGHYTHTHTHTTVLWLCGICPGKPG